MNFIEEARGFNYRRDKEEEQEQSVEEEEERIGGEDEEGRDEEDASATTTRNNVKSSTIKHQYISNLPSTSCNRGSAATALSASPHHFSYEDFLPGLHPHIHHRSSPPPSSAQLVDISFGKNSSMAGGGGEGTSGMMMMEEEVEKEHMFDKVVTPSDVGKLNRLVIPKQYAEKYFPLDGSSNEKGLLLNFDDREGKSWRFRYSYWNSSQSYVMTRGWSRFVKDKKLDAGDIVSFQRGAGEDSSHRLFIDCKRRPNIGSHLQFPMAHHYHHLDFQSVRWNKNLLYSQPLAPPLPHFHYSLPGNYNQLYERGGTAPYYVRPAGHLRHQAISAVDGGDDMSPMVIDSVPVVQGRTVGKRLRLFGVNVDCPNVPSIGSSKGDGHHHHHHHHHHRHGDEADSSCYNRPTHGLILAPPHHLGSSSSSYYPCPSRGNYMSTHQFPPGAGSSPQLQLPGGGGGHSNSSSTQSHDLSNKGKITSLSFDLDL